MKRIFKYSTLAITTILLNTNAFAGEAKVHTKHWGYSGDVAPSQWSELDKKFHTCSEGKQQSPIDVLTFDDVILPQLDLRYKSGAKSIAKHTETGHTLELNNGHTVEVELSDGNIFMIDEVDYHLKQFHFHTPSENHVKGISYPMEAHFVHATKEGKLAVIAVMFEEGKENPTLTKILSGFPLEHNKESELDFNANDLVAMMPENKTYYKFMGSLTTPPCTEQVKWFVLKTPLEASKTQIEKMHKEIGMNNNRPIQATNDRNITK